MRMRDYAVIRLDRPRAAGVSVFQQLAAESETNGPRLTVESMSDRDHQSLTRDDRYVVHAPAFPLELIAPVASVAVQDHDGAEEAWGIREVHAHTSDFRGEGVNVAILDSGIDLEHDAFRSIARDRIEVRDFSASGPGDPLGHGTHCAATIFGQDVNGLRIGVAPNIRRAFVGRVFGNTGDADTLKLFEAMQWAINSRAHVVSMSLGFNFPGLVATRVASGVPVTLATAEALRDYTANLRVFDTLVRLAHDLVPLTGGSIIVAAAGNESQPTFRLPLAQPACSDGVLSVAAAEKTPEGLRIASFSNTGATVTAPGVGVVSAEAGQRGALRSMSGTSMATPHVAGVAALWFEALRKRGERAIAPIVANYLSTRTSTSGFAPNTAVADRGNGLVQAP